MASYSNPQKVAANATIAVGGPKLHAFLASAAGTITVTDDDGTVWLSAYPVVAGFNRLDMGMNTSAGYTFSSTVAGVVLK